MADRPFQRAALRRWPRYTIRGEGEWAVVCPVIELVTLYDFPMLAEVEMQEPHSNWGCTGQHKLERVKPAYQPTAVILKSPSDMERD